ADLETVGGQRLGFLQQPGPFGAPLRLVEVSEGGDDTRHTDGAAGTTCIRNGCGFILGRYPDQVVLVGGHRCGLATVDGGDLVGAGVIVEDVATATDAGGLRLGETEDELRGDQCIRCGSALAENIAGGA